MAKKLKPRIEQYREILAGYGKDWADCHVLAFQFDGEYGPNTFHYELMYPLRPVYHLFDRIGNVAQIVVPRDAENDQMCRILAESCGGEEISPVLI